jgi:putative ABC transport system permease protein
MLESKWQSLAAGLPFEYYFLDSDVARQYRAEERWDKIVTYSSTLAVFIACLGLFGLSALSASRRTREIGIRKVLGATVPRLLGVISREHLFLVILGNVVAWPIAYFTVNQWLQNFAYRIQPGIGSFLLAATAALVIALLTVSYQGIKAALANPVDSLRYE